MAQAGQLPLSFVRGLDPWKGPNPRGLARGLDRAPCWRQGTVNGMGPGQWQVWGGGKEVSQVKAVLGAWAMALGYGEGSRGKERKTEG